MTLRIAEELLLLVLNEDHGGLAYVPERHLDCALAGPVLTDLALENRIDTAPETEKLTLVDLTPVGDDLLDPALTEVAQEEEPHEAWWWVRRIAHDGERIRERVLAAWSRRASSPRRRRARRSSRDCGTGRPSRPRSSTAPRVVSARSSSRR